MRLNIYRAGAINGSLPPAFDAPDHGIATACHTPCEGSCLGGQDNIAAANDPYQQSADGAGWAVVPDPRDLDSNLQLGDMTTNALGNLLAFKHEVDDDHFVGWVDLDLP